MPKETKAKVVYRSLSELCELENNPRTIGKKDMERLKTSIKDNADYFEARPLILSNRTGKLVILAGNQRYKAALALGLSEVPTVLLEGLTEEREKEIIIRDNVSNGDWDMDILANEWNDEFLAKWGVDVPAPQLGEAGSLGRDFIISPFTVLDTRAKVWQNRKKIWSQLFQSQKGRKEELTFADQLGKRYGGGNVSSTSICDPVLCEFMYRWFGVGGGGYTRPLCGRKRAWNSSRMFRYEVLR